MKAVNLKQLKTELEDRSQPELIELCLKLSKFKKENKELLTYLLFEAHDEEGYIESVKETVAPMFETINRDSYYYIKKSIRKILRELRKYIRYSKKPETEVELLLFFLSEVKAFQPPIQRNVALTNLYQRQVVAIQKKLKTLHEDLQYDYQMELEDLYLDIQ